MNIRSVRSYLKIDNIEHYVQLNNPHLILLTETWLRDDEAKYYQVPGYYSLHKCRKSRGGGVSIFIREGIDFQELIIDSKSEIDNCDLVLCKLNQFKVKIGCIYKAPHCNTNTFCEYINSILVSHKNLIMVGDTNIDTLTNNSANKQFTDIIYLNSYKIQNKNTITRLGKKTTGSCIDHVIIPLEMSATIKTTDTPISDHKLLNITVTLPQKISNIKTKKSTYFTDYKILKQIIIEKKNKIKDFDQLVNMMTEAKNKATTKVTIKIKNNNMWYNNKIKVKIKKRDKIYRIMKKTGATNHKAKFSKLKNEVTNEIRKAKKAYINNSVKAAGNNPKKIWQLINKITKTKTACTSPQINELKIDNIIISDPHDITEKFNHYFVNVANQIQKNIPNISHKYEEIQSDCSIYMNKCTLKELKQIISSLKLSNSTIEDNISSKDLKEIFPVIDTLLLNLINDVLKSGVFPSSLKISKVIPVYKKGLKSDPANYRPISICSVFSKIIEKVLHNRLINFIAMGKHQYGFQKSSSTLGAVVDLVEYITERLDRSEHIVAVFIDMQKAFDTVNHRYLLGKIEGMGIRGTALKLIETFITDRLQYVDIDGIRSKKLKLKIGVPQGTVLGPLLYLLYVESISRVGLECKYIMFADDTVFVFNDKSEEKMVNNLNRELKQVYEWCCFNKLCINIEKTSYMRFYQKNTKVKDIKVIINNREIENVKCYKYLGLLIDEKLSWANHLDHILGRLRSLVGATRHIKGYLTSTCARSFYYAHFQSIVMYLFEIWSNTSATNLKRLQSLQRNAIKIIFNMSYDQSIENKMKELKIYNIEQLKELSLCKLIHTIVNSQKKTQQQLKANSTKHSYDTRTAPNIMHKKVRSTIPMKSPITTGIKIYNSLPADIRNIKDLNKFITRLKTHLYNK